jgi:hypothetical protein
MSEIKSLLVEILNETRRNWVKNFEQTFWIWKTL